MAPKIHFTLTDKQDCEEVLLMIRDRWPSLFVVEQPEPEPTPAPEPTPDPTPTPAPEPTPDPTPTPPPEPTSEPVSETSPEIVGQDSESVTDPPVTIQGDDYTRDMLQSMIRGYLTPLKGDDEKMTAAKKGLIDVLLATAGVGSSATVPEDKMNETYLAVQAHIEEAPF